MFKKAILFFTFFLISICALSQTLTVKVQNEAKEPILANVLIKNSENKNLISEFFKTEDNGEFKAVLEKNYSKIYFEVTAMGYQKIADSIINPEKGRTYAFNYILKNKTTELEEVVIKEEKYKIEGDTTSFNPKSYKDGTEKKVEDLIKKLPGMEVDANGTIKYRGKSVTSVQLEGDDMFGDKYAIGTRNISVDMIEKLQAIDNYSANPLLKGIENTDNVAINLKLKKGKLDISVDGNIGSGFDSKIKPKNEFNFNALGVSKRYKSFGSINYNNIGYNNTAEDYFSMNNNLEDIQNEELLAKKGIIENPFSSSFDAQRANINNQSSIGYNIIYRFSKKLSLKTNMSFVKDKIYLLDENKTVFNTQNISYIDSSENIRNPEKKQLNLKLTYNTSKVSLLEIETTLQKENINSTNTVLQNQNSNFNTILNTENLFWKNKLEYTYKISNKKALQFISNYAINSIPQELSINPTTFSFGGNLQKSEFEKKYLSNKIVLLGSSKKVKYAFTVGSVFENNPFISNLLESSNLISPDFQNQFNYKKATLYSEIGTTYVMENWKLQPTVRLSNINQNYQNKTENSYKRKNSLVIIPNLNISYLLNSKSTFKLSGNYEEKTPNEENLFTNFIAQNNRFIKRNNLNLNLQQNQNYALNYRFNDLFSSFSTNLALIYDKKKNTYLSSVDVQDDYVIYNLFQSPANIENYSLFFAIEKYIPFLNTTIKHTSNYGINKYKNIVNQSELRSNQSLNYNAYFYISTAFRLPVNFQNKFNYSTSNYKSDDQSNNVNISLNNSLKTIFKPNKYWLFTLSFDYYLPNSKKTNDFTFFDFEIKYKPRYYKDMVVYISGKNLLNNEFYSQTENSDFQSTIYQSSLMPRYLMLTLDYNF